MIKKLLSCINGLIPKCNIVVFNSFPPFSDNAKELYLYLNIKHPELWKKYKFYWTQNNIKDLKNINGAKIVKKWSLEGLWLFLRAKIVISTHCYSADIKAGKDQIQMNLWHGCGYKSITDNDKCYQGNYTIVTSELYKNINSKELQIPIQNTYVTGLPRNDRLFNSSNELKKLGINNDSISKLYIWLPTYRKAKFGHDLIDGDDNSFGISSITENEFDQLNSILINNNSILIIKPHPMDSIGISKIRGYSNILGVDNDKLKELNIELYSLLSECDCLLSDYSSVIIDFLLLNKPIAMVLADKADYQKTRGFVFDSVDEYFPGPIISSFSELINYLTNCKDIDELWEEKRIELKNLFHKYVDGNSCERVYSLLFKELGS